MKLDSEYKITGVSHWCESLVWVSGVSHWCESLDVSHWCECAVSWPSGWACKPRLRVWTFSAVVQLSRSDSERTARCAVSRHRTWASGKTAFRRSHTCRDATSTLAPPSSPKAAEARSLRCVLATRGQCFFFSRNIVWFTPKIVYFYFLINVFLDRSIQKKIYCILKTEALLEAYSVCRWFCFQTWIKHSPDTFNQPLFFL